MRRLITLCEAANVVHDLITHYGGRAIPFGRLPKTVQQAILQRELEHRDPDDPPLKIARNHRVGYVELPMEALQTAVLGHVQSEGSPHQSFDEYHRWYVGHGDTPHYTEVWPIELDPDGHEVILDGSHRFHSYVRSGVKVVPAYYRV